MRLVECRTSAGCVEDLCSTRSGGPRLGEGSARGGGEDTDIGGGATSALGVEADPIGGGPTIRWIGNYNPRVTTWSKIKRIKKSSSPILLIPSQHATQQSPWPLTLCFFSCVGGHDEVLCPVVGLHGPQPWGVTYLIF